MPEQEDSLAMGTADRNDDREQVLSNVMGVVRTCLVRLKAGDLFMDGLERECYSRLRSSVTAKNDAGDEQLTEDFLKFLGVVADDLVKEMTGDNATPENSKQQKRMRKRWLKFLKGNWESVEQEIHNDGTDRAGSGAAATATAASAAEEAAPSGGSGAQQQAEGESPPQPQENELADSDANGVELDGDDNTSYSSASHGRLKKKSKKKKKEKRKKKKKKSKKVDDVEDEADEATYEDNQTSAEVRGADSYMEKMEEFERFRDKILSQVPEEVKMRFKQPGFAQWSKNWLPVLEMGPFDVPPGLVRDQWFSMFENCTESGRPLTRLVYWYGTQNLDEAYSFVQAKKVMPYEEGLEKGHGEIPRTLQKKQEKGKAKLTKSDIQILKALEQVKIDAELEPNERVEWLPEWDEVDEDNLLPTQEDEVEEPQEEAEAELEPVQPAKKSKKRKKGKGHEEKKKKKKKRKVSKDEGQVEDIDEGNASEVEKTVEKSVVEEPDDFEYSSAEDNDEAFSDEVESDSEGDEDFVEEGTTKKRKPKPKDGAASQKKKSKRTPEEQAEHEEKLARRREVDRKRREAKREAESGGKSDGPVVKKPLKKKGKSSKLAEEQRHFEECEDIFLPLIERLKRALNADDFEAAEQSVKGFQENVEMTTPSFVRHHQFGMFVKESRKKFEAKGRDDLVSLCRDLTKDLKRVYNEKLASEPDGFEPKIRKSAKKEGTNDRKRPKVEEGASAESSEPRQQPAVNLEDSQAKELKIPKKEDGSMPSKASVPSTIEQTEQTQAPQQAKPARKKFSLKGMFERPKKPPTPKERVPDRAPVAAQPVVKKQIPSWLTGPKLSDDIMPEDDERSLALEFLEDAFAQFPSDKVNASASSLALESALFEWSTISSSRPGMERSEAYWEKIHDIVAALVGKNESGSLVQKILEGEFETPRDMLRITRKKLNRSLSVGPIFS